MDGATDRVDVLLRSGARRPTGSQRRLFPAEVTEKLCGGSARLGRTAVRLGVYTDEYDIYSRLEEWGYDHETV